VVGIASKKSNVATLHPKSNNTTSVNLSKEEYLELFKTMVSIRRFEERAGQLYGMGLIGGFCHLYIGQEAVVTGLQKLSIEGDQVITTYRDHGHMIAVGTDPKVIYAELMGKNTGCSKGKGGSMHMFDLNRHFYGGHGIVGASVPLGTGLAFANKYRGNNNICFNYFGDGAANQGQVYESFNMASLWKLPVVYVIENNEYAMGTSVARSSATTNLYKRGEGFGIPGFEIDGMDVEIVIKEAKKAVDYVRSGNGPVLLEMKTYRYRGHSMSDPAKYRTKEEVSLYRDSKDPIDKLKNTINKLGFASEELLKKFDDEIILQMQQAIDFAKNSSEPDLAELWTDIYS
jgi:pyruvate dehydrogenase E1 component alpha subunit